MIDQTDPVAVLRFYQDSRTDLTDQQRAEVMRALTALELLRIHAGDKAIAAIEALEEYQRRMRKEPLCQRVTDESMQAAAFVCECLLDEYKAQSAALNAQVPNAVDQVQATQVDRKRALHAENERLLKRVRLLREACGKAGQALPHDVSYGIDTLSDALEADDVETQEPKMAETQTETGPNAYRMWVESGAANGATKSECFNAGRASLAGELASEQAESESLGGMLRSAEAELEAEKAAHTETRKQADRVMPTFEQLVSVLDAVDCEDCHERWNRQARAVLRLLTPTQAAAAEHHASSAIADIDRAHRYVMTDDWLDPDEDENVRTCFLALLRAQQAQQARSVPSVGERAVLVDSPSRADKGRCGEVFTVLGVERPDGFDPTEYYWHCEDSVGEERHFHRDATWHRVEERPFCREAPPASEVGQLHELLDNEETVTEQDKRMRFGVFSADGDGSTHVFWDSQDKRQCRSMRTGNDGTVIGWRRAQPQGKP